MIVYEFYKLDPEKQYELIGVLPEKRKNPARITQDSVINWGVKYLGNIWDMNDIFCLQLTIDENTGSIFRTTPLFETQEIM